MSELATLSGAAFLGGLATSAGPCIAPRYLLAASLAVNVRSLLIFVAGALCGCALFACAGAVIALAQGGSHLIYAAIACALVIGGLSSLTFRGCGNGRRPASALSTSTPFLLGVGSTVLVSPCCAPLGIALGMSVSGGNDSAFAAVPLLAFALGHLFPLLALALAVRSVRIPHSFADPTFADAMRTIRGSLSLAIGLLYGLLA